jgi:Uma2 family endonuclease
MRPSRVPLPGTVYDPLYPETDGTPMSETDPHTSAVIWLRQALKDFFARSPDVYVASQLMVYYEQGNPAGHRDPDVMVVRGVGRHRRISFRVWEEGTLPCVVFEIASDSTWREDLGPKRDLYARLGIAEYFLFAPEGRMLDPRLQGFRLENGVYVPLTAAADGALESAELGLRLLPERRMLRLINLATGRRIPTRSERSRRSARRAREARRLANEVNRRADESSRQVDVARHEADEARRRADEATRQVDEARRHGENLAAELARLREQLANRDRPDAPSAPPA